MACDHYNTTFLANYQEIFLGYQTLLCNNHPRGQQEMLLVLFLKVQEFSDTLTCKVIQVASTKAKMKNIDENDRHEPRHTRYIGVPHEVPVIEYTVQ